MSAVIVYLRWTNTVLIGLELLRNRTRFGAATDGDGARTVAVVNDLATTR